MKCFLSVRDPLLPVVGGTVGRDESSKKNKYTVPQHIHEQIG